MAESRSFLGFVQFDADAPLGDARRRFPQIVEAFFTALDVGVGEFLTVAHLVQDWLGELAAPGLPGSEQGFDVGVDGGVVLGGLLQLGEARLQGTAALLVGLQRVECSGGRVAADAVVLVVVGGHGLVQSALCGSELLYLADHRLACFQRGDDDGGDRGDEDNAYGAQQYDDAPTQGPGAGEDAARGRRLSAPRCGVGVHVSHFP